MRTRVTENLWFDDLSGCEQARESNEPIAIVHACKEPCHRRAVGYAERSLKPGHPHYLWLEKPGHLYLNMIDPPLPLFKPESFSAFFEFTDREIATPPVLIHCNKGESRAPSLTLLYMAKRLGLLPGESYESAAATFSARFSYKPGQGIATFLQKNWNDLG